VELFLGFVGPGRESVEWKSQEGAEELTSCHEVLLV
jgi:hypothetical protein